VKKMSFAFSAYNMARLCQKVNLYDEKKCREKICPCDEAPIDKEEI
jgi:hypothetical protein